MPRRVACYVGCICKDRSESYTSGSIYARSKYVVLCCIKIWKTSAVSTTDWMVETQLCKLCDTSDTLAGREYCIALYTQVANMSFEEKIGLKPHRLTAVLFVFFKCAAGAAWKPLLCRLLCQLFFVRVTVYVYHFNIIQLGCRPILQCVCLVPGCCVENLTHLKKAEIRLGWDLNPGPLLFVHNKIKHWAHRSAMTATWSPNLFCSFIMDKPLSYSVNADWVFSQKIVLHI